LEVDIKLGLKRTDMMMQTGFIQLGINPVASYCVHCTLYQIIRFLRQGIIWPVTGQWASQDALHSVKLVNSSVQRFLGCTSLSVYFSLITFSNLCLQLPSGLAP